MVGSAKVEKGEEEGDGLEEMKPNGGDRQFKAVGDQGWAGLRRLRLWFSASAYLKREEAGTAAFGRVDPLHWWLGSFWNGGHQSLTKKERFFKVNQREPQHSKCSNLPAILR